MKKGITLIISILLSVAVFAQKDFSSVNFGDEYKVKTKISGGFAKSLKSSPSFISNYQLHQATVMKGSESTATTAVFAEIKLNGITQESYQKLADEMYQELVSEFKNAGINIVNGEEVLQSKPAQKKIAKAGNGDLFGKTSSNPAYEGKRKISEGSMPGYGAWAVLRDISFPPSNTNLLFESNTISNGTFQMGLAKKTAVNIITVDFYVSFASFDGGRGYKSIGIEVNPVIAVNMIVGMYAPNGSFNYIEYKKMPVWGTDEWSQGVSKTDENDGSAFGLSSSADFQVTADEDKYITEVKSIISNLQKDMVKNIKSEL